MVSRFAGPLHYVATLPLRLAPWTLLLPAIALAWRPLLRGATGAALRFPVTWFGVVFVLLHVTSAKHARYLLPALPAVALLSRRALDRRRRAGALAALAPRVRRCRDGALAILLGLGALAGVAAPVALVLQPAARNVWPLLRSAARSRAWVSIAGLRLLRSGGDADRRSRARRRRGAARRGGLRRAAQRRSSSRTTTSRGARSRSPSVARRRRR